MEMMVIAPFTTPTGYEIVHCSLETPGFIFLDCIPRPDVGCLPCIGGLHIFHEHLPEEGSTTSFNRPGIILTSVTFPFPLSFCFGALPLPFRRGTS